MRIAALYDVHGNRPALEAVLAELEGEQIDEIVFGGDLTWGPQPHETLELVWSVSNARFVRGNADREPDEWERSRLSPEEVAFLQGQPPTVEVDGVLYCHATPRSDEEVVGHVREAAGALQLVRDRLGQRVLLVGIKDQGPRPLHQLEELEGLHSRLVREEDRGADLLVALVDLVEVHPQYTMTVPCLTLPPPPRPPNARSATPSAATRDRRSRSRWRSMPTA